MSGMLGRLLREFAVTICVAILVSGFISLSLTPMLCSRYLRPPHDQKHGWFYNFLGRCLDAMNKAYEVTLAWVMRHHVTTMVASVVVLIATVYMFGLVPKGFIPSEDTGQVLINTEGAQGVADRANGQEPAAARCDRRQRSQRRIVLFQRRCRWCRLDRTIPGEFLSSSIRSDAVRSEKRKLNADEVIRELRPKLAQVPGIRVSLAESAGDSRRWSVEPKPLSVHAAKPGRPGALSLRRAYSKSGFERCPIFAMSGAICSSRIRNSQVVIDRDRASTMGITRSRDFASARSKRRFGVPMRPGKSRPSIRPTINIRSSSKSIPSFRTILRRCRCFIFVRPPAKPARRSRWCRSDRLATLNYTVGSDVGESLRTTAVGDDFLQSARRGGARATRLRRSTNLPGKSCLLRSRTTFQGTAQEFQKSITSLWVLLALAVFVVYLVLGILYESFIHPLTILSGLPSAGLGALIALYLFNMDLSIYAFVGLIMLIGIVKKNAIMMIDFALEAQRNENKTPAQAIYDGALVRFRPIMMTTMAAIYGRAADRHRLGRRRGSQATSRHRGRRRFDHLADFDPLHYARRVSLSGEVSGILRCAAGEVTPDKDRAPKPEPAPHER